MQQEGFTEGPLCQSTVTACLSPPVIRAQVCYTIIHSWLGYTGLHSECQFFLQTEISLAKPTIMLSPMDMHRHIQRRIHTDTSTFMHVCTHTLTCTRHTYAHWCIHTHSYMKTRMCAHICTYIHKYNHNCTYLIMYFGKRSLQCTSCL